MLFLVLKSIQVLAAKWVKLCARWKIVFKILEVVWVVFHCVILILFRHAVYGVSDVFSSIN